MLSQRDPLKTQALGMGKRSRAKQAEQPVSGKWQPYPMKLPGYSRQLAGGRKAGEKESITGTPVFHLLPLLP